MKAVLFDTKQEACDYSYNEFPRHDGVTQYKWDVVKHGDKWAALVDDSVDGAVEIELNQEGI